MHCVTPGEERIPVLEKPNGLSASGQGLLPAVDNTQAPGLCSLKIPSQGN